MNPENSAWHTAPVLGGFPEKQRGWGLACGICALGSNTGGSREKCRSSQREEVVVVSLLLGVQELERPSRVGLHWGQ